MFSKISQLLDGFKVHLSLWSGVLVALAGVVYGGKTIDLGQHHFVVPAVEPATLLKAIWVACSGSAARSTAQKVIDSLKALEALKSNPGVPNAEVKP